MKKTLFSVLFTLALCLAVLPASAQEDVYTLLGPDGQAVTQYMGECEAGDEYISGDNLHYRVVSVDPQAKTAQLELLGDADMPDVSWLEMEQSLAVSATNNRKIALYCTHSDESYIEGDGTESDEERGGIYDVAAAFGDALEERGVSVTLSDATHHPHDAALTAAAARPPWNCSRMDPAPSSTSTATAFPIRTNMQPPRQRKDEQGAPAGGQGQSEQGCEPQLCQADQGRSRQDVPRPHQGYLYGQGGL